MEPITVNNFSAIEQYNIAKTFFQEKDPESWKALCAFLASTNKRCERMTYEYLAASKGRHETPMTIAEYFVNQLSQVLVPVDVLLNGLERCNMMKTREFVEVLQQQIFMKQLHINGQAAAATPYQNGTATPYQNGTATPYPHAPTIMRVEVPKQPLPSSYNETPRPEQLPSFQSSRGQSMLPQQDPTYAAFAELVEKHGLEKVRDAVATLVASPPKPDVAIATTSNQTIFMRSIPKEVRKRMAQLLASSTRGGMCIGVMFETKYKFVIDERDARAALNWSATPVMIVECMLDTIANHNVTKADFVAALRSDIIGYPALICDNLIRDHFAGYH